MATLMEYVGALHIFLGPYRGNPISLYLSRNGNICRIGPKVYPWKEVVGEGDTPNRAAADFEEKWKARGLSPDMYTGPSWEGGIKPEKPAPPKPAAAPKPAPAIQPHGDARDFHRIPHGLIRIANLNTRQRQAQGDQAQIGPVCLHLGSDQTGPGALNHPARDGAP